jgi:hypothetical protein
MITIKLTVILLIIGTIAYFITTLDESTAYRLYYIANFVLGLIGFTIFLIFVIYFIYTRFKF